MLIERFGFWGMGPSENNMRHKFLSMDQNKKPPLGLSAYQEIYQIIRQISLEFGVCFFIFKMEQFPKGKSEDCFFGFKM